MPATFKAEASEHSSQAPRPFIGGDMGCQTATFNGLYPKDRIL